jgi:hypothetical protein
MKKTLISLFLVLCAGFASAQTILLNTTLSASATSSQKVITLTSASGVTAPSPTNNQLNTYLLVDAELMSVQTVSGTQITVTRGIGGTAGRGHASGALVFVEPAYLTTGFQNQVPKTGACTRGNELALPIIGVTAGRAFISDCLNGQWVSGDATQTTRATNYRLPQPIIGNVAYTSALGTSTATTAAELYCTEIDLPYSKLITGVAAHIGATGGTDKWIVALYDAGGNLIANSATAGATVGGTGYAFNAEALTAPYYLVGPAQYFGCVQSNGTTATLDLITTGTNDLLLTYKSASAGTFGTLPNFTAPTSFGTLKGPYLYLY